VSNFETEGFSAHFPVEDVKVDYKELERHWSNMIKQHPEFTIPCFTCQFFHECNSGSKHDPIPCEILFEWFIAKTGALVQMVDEVSSQINR
jgi:hypothetical protein